MIDARRAHPRPSGVTLVELMVAMAITAVVAMLATQTHIAFVREDAMRRKITNVQGNTRFALDILTREFRHASLGVGTGRIWTESNSNRVARPAVQIFSSIRGAGSLSLASSAPVTGNPKQFTDALVVVEAFGGERSATVGEITSATPGMPRAFRVTTTSTTADVTDHTLDLGEAILVGDYQDASWGVLASVTAGPQLTVTQDLRLPGAQVPRLPAGALVRRARARLYYLDTSDQLVRLDLNVPRAPTAASEIIGREVLASGIENLQIGCEVTTSTGALAPQTAVLAIGHAIRTESAAAFAFEPGGGPMLQADDPSGAGGVSNLRTIVFNVVARSPTPIVGSIAGDPRIELDGVTLGNAQDAWVRRAYQLPVGVRNVSLGDL